jgi:hypothetical protein
MCFQIVEARIARPQNNNITPVLLFHTDVQCAPLPKIETDIKGAKNYE